MDASMMPVLSMPDFSMGMDLSLLMHRPVQAKAADLVVPNAYGSVMMREGGVGLNATTSLDQVGGHGRWDLALSKPPCASGSCHSHLSHFVTLAVSLLYTEYTACQCQEGQSRPCLHGI